MTRRSDGRALLMAAALLALPVGAWAEDADCAALVAGLKGISGGYEITEARPFEADGWCRIDGLVLRGKAEDVPNISAKTARARGTRVDGVLTALEVEATGVRVAPKIGDRRMDDRLRSFLRLQTADLLLSATWDEDADVLSVGTLAVTLPGRNRLGLSAEIKGADLSSATALLGGSVTALDVQLVTDGRVAGPVMEMAGRRMLPDGADDGSAVAAVREVLAGVIDAMPAAALDDEGKSELTRMLAGLPRTTGTLEFGLRSGDGISPARLALHGLRDDPLAPTALAALFEGAALTVDWQPGATP